MPRGIYDHSMFKGRKRPDISGENSPMKDPKIAKRCGDAHRGKHYPKRSESLRGDKNPAKLPGVGLKISKAKIGFKFSKSSKKKMSFSHLGQKVTEIHPLNCSCFPCRFSRGEISGINHPNWQGGLSNFPYPFAFNNKLKELIRERDGYICQLCSKTQEENNQRLSIHHIDYDKDNLDPKNLISLCRSCNCKVNYNREYWTEFFKRRMTNA